MQIKISQLDNYLSLLSQINNIYGLVTGAF